MCLLGFGFRVSGIYACVRHDAVLELSKGKAVYPVVSAGDVGRAEEHGPLRVCDLEDVASIARHCCYDVVARLRVMWTRPG
jgi:hypothetical protein